MFRFANPEYFYILLVLPILAALYIIGNIRYKKRMLAFGDPLLVKALMPDRSNTKRVVRFWIMFACVAFIAMLLARPQFGSSQTTVKRVGIETVIALDISNSMLAQDVAPSRLEKSKRLISNLVDEFQDDKVGLILFAGDAFVQLPITSDFISAKLFLSTINTQSVKRQGTNIKDALSLCMKSFTAQDNIGRAIILITDGENHEDGAIEAARMVKEKGYKLFVLGIGSTSGSPISTDDGKSYKKDKDGQVIITRLNESMCKELAVAGGGKYFFVDNSNSAERALRKEIETLSKADIETTIYSAWDEQFWIVAIVILVLLLLEMFISERQSKLIRKLKSKNILTLLLLLSVPGLLHAQYTDRDYIRKGNRVYKDSLFTKAETRYLQALDLNKESATALYNLSNTYIDQTKYQEAAGKIDTAIILQKERLQMLQTDPQNNAQLIESVRKELSMSYHNKGVIHHAGQDYGKAIEAYKESLRLNPSDNETRYNLLRAMHELKKQQDQQQQQQDQQQQNQNQDKNKDNKNNKDKKNQDQNQDQDKQDQDKQEQDQQQNQDKNQQDNQNQQNQQNQPEQRDQMSREAADQLLEAAMQDEKDVQERVKEALMQTQQRSYDKDW